ncbi:TPA: hypothetical protein P0E36_005400 [Vibrio harveyi]|nr:hypothetical protein [Vibrio harveyi]HDM8199192.1 hypothetical protein [Vibrio harveyi]
MEFSGLVKARSSSQCVNVGPPGEAEVMRLNPRRVEKMKLSMGWGELAEGSLNLMVSEKFVHELLLCEPVFKENGSEVIYPSEFQHIPQLRVGYLYYSGIAKASNGKSCQVLVRRACNALNDRVELFSNMVLREHLYLEDNDRLSVEIVRT